MRYEIAIPSYKRAIILKTTTLLLLENHNIDKTHVKIFIRDEDEKESYVNVIGDSWDFIITNCCGICNTRNFLRTYYHNHDINFNFVLFIDDDIKNVCERVDSKNIKPIENLEKLIFEMYHETAKRNLRLFGLCGFVNPFFLKNTVTSNLKYIIGAFCGIVNSKQSLIQTNIGHAEDYDFTIKHFLEDGGVVRFNKYCILTKYYNIVGGICEDSGGKDARNKEAKINCTYLAIKYPKLCKIVEKSNGTTDLKLNHFYQKK